MLPYTIYTYIYFIFYFRKLVVILKYINLGTYTSHEILLIM